MTGALDAALPRSPGWRNGLILIDGTSGDWLTGLCFPPKLQRPVSIRRFNWGGILAMRLWWTEQVFKNVSGKTPFVVIVACEGKARGVKKWLSGNAEG